MEGILGFRKRGKVGMGVSYMTDLLEENAEGAFFAKALVNTVSFLL